MAWRKSWSGANLHPEGTKRKLTPVQRSIWDDCLDLAETSEVTGTLTVKPGIPYTLEQMAQIFKTPKKAIQESLEIFRREEMLGADWSIINWNKYQSDYNRVKKWRNEKAKN